MVSVEWVVSKSHICALHEALETKILLTQVGGAGDTLGALDTRVTGWAVSIADSILIEALKATLVVSDRLGDSKEHWKSEKSFHFLKNYKEKL